MMKRFGVALLAVAIAAGASSLTAQTVTSGLLDLRDRFDAVFLEIAEDSDEAGAKLATALLEMHPINDVPSVAGHIKLLKRRIAPDVVPPPLN